MRKIVAGLFMSLDGVVESPSNWRLFDDETWQVITAGIAESDAILLGRSTYLEFAGFWPKQGGDVPMAEYMNSTPKYVVSSTLDVLHWANSHRIVGNLASELTQLKQQPGKNIQVPGSPRLVQSLLRDGLLDELSLMIQPVVVGSGRRLFDEMSDRIGLKLVDSLALNNGVLSVTYRRTNS